jgi:uncharacterized protein
MPISLLTVCRTAGQRLKSENSRPTRTDLDPLSNGATMPWIALCFDRDDIDTGTPRRTERDAHFTYIESILDRILIAGPLAAPGGGRYSASLFIYRVDSEKEARQLLEADPYYRAGIYARTEFHPFIPAAGEWIGGTLWHRQADGTIVVPPPPQP